MKFTRLFSKTLFATLVTAFCAAGSAFAQVNLEEGKEYKKLAKPQPVDVANKVEVIEFFSFGCDHCRAFEPTLQEWQKKMPADVHFKRIPVSFQPAWAGYSKILFTLEALGESDKLAPAVFDAIHKDGKKLNDKEIFYAWAASRGLDVAKVKAAYEGFTTDSKVKRADQAVRTYAVDSVPMLVIDGKFVTAPSMVKNGHAGMPSAIDFLIAKARQEKGK